MLPVRSQSERNYFRDLRTIKAVVLRLSEVSPIVKEEIECY